MPPGLEMRIRTSIVIELCHEILWLTAIPVVAESPLNAEQKEVLQYVSPFPHPVAISAIVATRIARVRKLTPRDSACGGSDERKPISHDDGRNLGSVGF